ncbi:UNVERIFIED_CONTAM: hypothetical protein FKN15_042900 [Acipenser sinensis]
MDHTLFGCLRSPHAPAQGLHPAFSQSSLALHGRSDHVSYPDLSTSSPTCIIAGYSNDEGLFAGQHHRGHHQQHQQQQQHHQALQPNWNIPQMPSHSTATRHSLCLQPPDSGSPDLGTRPPNLCASTPSLSTSTPTGASCVPGDFGRQALSPAEAEKRTGKRKSDSSGVLSRLPGQFRSIPMRGQQRVLIDKLAVDHAYDKILCRMWSGDKLDN